MTPNDRLPEEITKQIESEAKGAAMIIVWGEYNAGPASSARMATVSMIDPIQKEFYIKGATAWAPWKVKHDELMKALQEFVSNHEAGLLPNRFVYEKAIKILKDGTR